MIQNSDLMWLRDINGRKINLSEGFFAKLGSLSAPTAILMFLDALESRMLGTRSDQYEFIRHCSKIGI